ncbi:MAG: hypothetical protein IKT98_08040 [Selenomonadaceae bacterium]|nr:hypothetical protein [Selenomonadaceae bacterium]
MKKVFVAVFCAIILSSSFCYAAEKTGILIVAPTQFKTQDFLKIANETFGKDYIVSQKTQDAWATYCWDKNFVDTDPTISKEILADFAKTTYFDKIIFVMFKDVESTVENMGVTVIYGLIRKNVRRRTSLQARVVIMNQAGETLQVFEESYTDASMASELRANRGAFKGLCKSIAERFNTNKLEK